MWTYPTFREYTQYKVKKELESIDGKLDRDMLASVALLALILTA
jgi:hypothetical protein